MNIDQIIAYEEGDLSDEEIIDLFADLIRSGEAWRLQGHYGRTAHRFIQAGVISNTGDVIQPS